MKKSSRPLSSGKSSGRAGLKKGSILLTVLIIVSVCTSAALFIHERAIASYGSVSDLQREYQGAIFAMTAIRAIETVFSYDDSRSDGADDLWNTIPSIPVDKGFISIEIKPLNARFPLNGLTRDNETVRERYEDGLERLLDSVNMASGAAEDLKSWLGTEKATEERIDENNAPYSFKGAPLNTLAELAYVPAFEYDFKELSKYISIGEAPYKININLASEEVILAVLPELEPYVGDILSERESASFKDVSEVYQLMGQNAQDIYNKILPYFDVKSSLFYVKIELNMLDENKYYHILFRRSGKSAKPVKYIEGGSLEYF